MSTPLISLAQCYKGWDTYQQQLVNAIAPLSPDQLTLQPAPTLRALGSQVAHIIATRARWLFLDLKEEDPRLETLMGWDGWTLNAAWAEPSTRTAAELVSGLATTWEIIQAALERWTTVDLEAVFPPTFPGEETFTRQYVIWHLIEHDLHHGGELSVALGIHGLAAPQL